MNLRRAESGEVDGFVALLEAAAQWQVARGIRQWLPGSMRAQRDSFVRAQARGELYLAGAPGHAWGGALLSQRTDALWTTVPHATACYVSKLVVDPRQHGKRLGEQLLMDCEEMARLRGCTIMRLDCVASNQALVRYYQQHGFYPRGAVNYADVALLRHDKRIDIAGPWLNEPFVPDTYATLMFVVAGESALLIRKQRGHGAGKINAPGGKVEPGETLLQCAVRETREEIAVRIDEATPLVELRFWDVDGSRMYGLAFKALRWQGTPMQTPEAVPLWCAIAELPYSAMWEDDILWLPWLLGDAPLSGDFLMADERLLAHRLTRASGTALAKAATVTRGGKRQ